MHSRMSRSSEMMGFAHSGDDRQRRYQRNTRASDKRTLEVEQPFVQLAQPLMAPIAKDQFNNSRFSGANRLLPDQVDQMASRQLPEKYHDDAINVVAMDEDTTIHGNWTITNAQLRLFCFHEAHGYPAGYIYFEKEHTDEKTFRKTLTYNCKKNLYLTQIDKMIKGEGEGLSKEIATDRCALSLIQHLYQLQLIEANIAPVKLRKKNDLQAEMCTIVPYKLALDQALESELDKVLKEMKVNIYRIPQHELGKTKSFPLKTKKVLTAAEIASFREYVLPQWCSPLEAWDPWLNCRITEGALAEMSMDHISKDLLYSRLNQLERDPLTQKMANERLKLPIFSNISKIMDAIQNNSVVIIQGPNGCGKSTQVPQYILDAYLNAGRGGECSIIVIQPSRISTVSIAERVTQERGETMGTSCGYSIRFDSFLPRPYGSILYCTADVVIKKLKSGLRGISHVIVDDVHERDINIDFILLVLKEMVRKYYNLNVVLLSAPIDVTVFSEYFFNCPIIDVSAGQNFPVTDFYLEDCIEILKFVPSSKTIRSSRKDSDDDDDENMNKVIGNNYLKTTAEAMASMNEEEISFELIEALLMYINLQNVPGAILIFLPGWSIISKLMHHLKQHATFRSPSYLILLLHSQLSPEEVNRVFQPAPLGVTKVILSSNIGENGITINDVIYVIDSCKIKLNHFNSHEIFFNSAIIWASKRNLEQRRGRVGRTQAGTCFRLCSRARFDRLKDDLPPAMTYKPIDELALAIKFLGLGSIYHFLSNALHPPALYLILQAETLLREIGVLDLSGELTSLGFILGQLPVRPQLGKMLVLSCLFHLGDPFCSIVPRTGILMELLDTTSCQQLNYARQHFQGNHCSDFITLLNAFAQWEKAQSHGKLVGDYFCEEFCFSKSAMEVAKNARRQFKGILQAAGFPEICLSEWYNTCDDNEITLDMISALLLVGYYPNVCYCNMRTKEVLVNGIVVTVDNSSLYNIKEIMRFSRSPFFVFEERINTKPEIREMTMVTPVQLLLFGHSRVEVIDGMIVLDGWIKLKMDLQLAIKLLALRKCLDALLYEVTYNPSLITSNQELHHVINIVKKLCSRNAIVRKEQSTK